MWTKIYSCQPHATMAILAFGTMGSGLVLLNPKTETFKGSSWALLAGLDLHLLGAEVRPDESTWGALLLLLGVCLWVGLWLLSKSEHDLEDGNSTGHLAQAVSVFNQAVAIGCASIWSGFAFSTIVSNPAGILSVWMVAGALASIFLVARMRALREAGGSGATR